MNSLLIYPEELRGSLAVLEGPRAEHVYDIHTLRSGDRTRIGIWGGRCGSGEILEASRKKAVLSISIEVDPPPKLNISAVIAIPRPPILRRVLMAAASCGVSKLDLVRSSGTEKSYLSSRELHPEKIKASLAAGLEQAIDTHPPAVTIHQRFLPLIDAFGGSEPGVRLIADPKGVFLGELAIDWQKPVTLAIGPEKGWSDFELARFDALGFQRISLGSRILRVDVALAYALGQIAVLKQVRLGF